jgi:hypothetical protein
MLPPPIARVELAGQCALSQFVFPARMKIALFSAILRDLL